MSLIKNIYDYNYFVLCCRNKRCVYILFDFLYNGILLVDKTGLYGLHWLSMQNN